MGTQRNKKVKDFCLINEQIINNWFDLRFSKIKLYLCPIRDVAQPGSVHVWGAWGRGFKSRHPDLMKRGLRVKLRPSFFLHSKQKLIPLLNFFILMNTIFYFRY